MLVRILVKGKSDEQRSAQERASCDGGDNPPGQRKVVKTANVGYKNVVLRRSGVEHYIELLDKDRAVAQIDDLEGHEA